MDFDQLHTFLEIVRLKSFSKAAQTCFRTQPAISAQIRQMEQELGTQLFERFGSRISLTTAGKIFAEHAQQLQDMRRQAFDAVRELDRVPRGEVVIAATTPTAILSCSPTTPIPMPSGWAKTTGSPPRVSAMCPGCRFSTRATW
jgi:DNA-binding transcriptional LysR family regulator